MLSRVSKLISLLLCNVGYDDSKKATAKTERSKELPLQKTMENIDNDIETFQDGHVEISVQEYIHHK